MEISFVSVLFSTTYSICVLKARSVWLLNIVWKLYVQSIMRLLAVIETDNLNK